MGSSVNKNQWDQWFEAQRELCSDIDAMIEGKCKRRSDQFRLAVTSAVIEHLSERMRNYIEFPEE